MTVGYVYDEDFSQEGEGKSETRSRLLPPKDFRRKVPRHCGTCAFGSINDGGFVCQRFELNGLAYPSDTGEGLYMEYVCDGYKVNSVYGGRDAERRRKHVRIAK